MFKRCWTRFSVNFVWENSKVKPEKIGIYRKGVGIMLFNKNMDVFMGRRYKTHSDSMEMPQGGIEHDETPVDAAYRELHEETGISSVKTIYKSMHWRSYVFPERLKPKRTPYIGSTIGQTQLWFLMEFLGEDTEINLRTHAYQEFKAWQWVALDQLVDKAVKFKRSMYAHIAQEFRPIFLG